jgi:hypothetical protein
MMKLDFGFPTNNTRTNRCARRNIMRSRSNHQKANNITPLQSNKSSMQAVQGGGSSDRQATLRPDLWDKRYSQKEKEMLLLVAQQYGLDPMTGEVMILHGKIYVTATGLQKLAINDPAYDGCEIDLVETDWANNFFVVKARIWKKNCAHPFEDYGDADPTTSSLRGHALFRHAITRARARAMRSAFAIPFCSLEELDDEMRMNVSQGNSRRRPKNGARNESKAPTPPAPPAPQRASTGGVTEQQLAMLERYIKDADWSLDQLHTHLQESFGVNSPEEMTRAQASKLLGELSAPPRPNTQKQETEQSGPTADVAEELGETEALDAKEEQTVEVTPSAEPVQEETQAKEVETAEPAPEESKEETPETAVAEPVVESKTAATETKKTQRFRSLPPWTADEQQRIADELVQRMQTSKTLKELRREWELFQGIRHQLSEEWFARICETKEQRKAVLMAA